MASTFSIIIPHKNIPELLQRCLNSIPIRDNIQIIIIDDDSNPNIVDFDSFPGTNRKNTEVVFTKEGKGAGYARNIGVKKAKGEWLLFADADDVFCEGISEALEILNSTNADLVYFHVEARDCYTLEPNDEASYQNLICEKIIQGDLETYKYHHEVPWGKAVRKSLVEDNNILFDELFCGNDSLFAIKCDYYSKKTLGCNILLYCWMTRPGSLWHNPNDNWFRTRFISRIHIINFFNSKGIKSDWSDQRLQWYLQSIKYKNSFDYIWYHWKYAIVCHHYGLILESVVNRLRVFLGSIKQRL